MNLALGFTNSGAEELQKKLPRSKVVKAFNAVFAKHMETGAAEPCFCGSGVARLEGFGAPARGFEGRMRCAPGVARLRKLSQLLEMRRPHIPASRRLSCRLRRILRTGCGHS